MEHLSEHLRATIAAPVYALAYVVGATVFWWVARRRGVATQGMACILGAGLVGGLTAANLAQLFATGLPGKSIEGGILGGWLGVVLAKRWLGMTQPTGDLFALAVPAGEAIGRIACFIGGCCSGRVTTVAWAVHDHGAWRHPAQLYLALAAVVSFAALAYAERRLRLPPNALFYSGGLLFCVDRFFVEFFRDVTPLSAGLTLAQVGCCVGAAVFAWKLVTLLEASVGARAATGTA